MGAHDAAVARTYGAAEREESFIRLYRDQFDMVFRLALRFGTPQAEVEDVAQKVFVVAHRRLSAGEEIGSPAAFLRAITVRVVADQRRWRRVRQVKAWLLRSTVEASAVEPTRPDGNLDASRVQQDVVCVLDQMSPKLRNVLVLSDVEECTPQEVAAVLGIPVNTVRSRRRLARARFQSLWHARRGEVDDDG